LWNSKGRTQCDPPYPAGKGEEGKGPLCFGGKKKRGGGVLSASLRAERKRDVWGYRAPQGGETPTTWAVDDERKGGQGLLLEKGKK